MFKAELLFPLNCFPLQNYTTITTILLVLWAHTPGVNLDC